jgi:hypothetical protein
MWNLNSSREPPSASIGPPLIADPFAGLILITGAMATAQRLENLKNIETVSSGIGLILFHRLIDDGGKVATATVFHEDVEGPRIFIDVSAAVSYDAVMQ